MMIMRLRFVITNKSLTMADHHFIFKKMEDEMPFEFPLIGFLFNFFLFFLTAIKRRKSQYKRMTRSRLSTAENN